MYLFQAIIRPLYQYQNQIYLFMLIVLLEVSSSDKCRSEQRFSDLIQIIESF